MPATTDAHATAAGSTPATVSEEAFDLTTSSGVAHFDDVTGTGVQDRTEDREGLASDLRPEDHGYDDPISVGGSFEGPPSVPSIVDLELLAPGAVEPLHTPGGVNLRAVAIGLLIGMAAGLVVVALLARMIDG